MILFEIEFGKILVNLAAQFNADALENIEQIIISTNVAEEIPEFFGDF